MLDRPDPFIFQEAHKRVGCARLHTHTHTHTHAHAHTRTHTHACTHPHTHMHAYTHNTHACTNTHTHAHTQTHTITQVCMYQQYVTTVSVYILRAKIFTAELNFFQKEYFVINFSWTQEIYSETFTSKV